MRKVVVMSFPTHGCLNPLLGTVAELVRRNEKVLYYCEEPFREKIENTGAEFRPYNGLIKEYNLNNYSDLFEGLNLILDMTVDKMHYDLEEIRKEAPDYILHDSLCPWGKYIADYLRIRAVNLMHSYPIIKSSIKLNRFTAPFILKVIFKKLVGTFKKPNVQNILRKQYDIEFSFADSMINEEDLNIVYTSDIFKPDRFNPKRKYIFTGPSLFFKNAVTDFPYGKLKDRTVIYISLGTLHCQNKHFYELCFDAFRNTEYLVIQSTGAEIGPEDFTEIPSNFLLRRTVPQQQLLEYVDLFITHAGMNSANEAICKGVPMLLLPHHFEQEMIATKIVDMGMGIKSNLRTLSSGRLTEIVRQMLSDPEFKKQAMKYRKKFEMEEKVSHIKAADEIMNFVQ